MDQSEDLSIKFGELANRPLDSKFKIAHSDTLVVHY